MKKGNAKVLTSAILVAMVMAMSLVWAASTSTHSTSVTVTNNAPVIISVTPPPAIDLNEGPATTTVYVNFVARDNDGVNDINDTSAVLTVGKAGERLITSPSCVPSNVSATEKNYNCSITFFWYDGAGSWGINTTVKDYSGTTATNNSQTLTVNTLKAIKGGPASISFGSVAVGATNVGATDDPFVLNNTGNVQIPSGNVFVKGYDLHGTTDNTRRIPAQNFSVNTIDASEGQSLTNATNVNVTSSILPIGNFTIADGTAQENLYYYLEQMPETVDGLTITAQAYDTSLIGAWVVGVN